MPDPNAADVAALLGNTDAGFLARADAALANVRAMVVGYTRWPAGTALPADLAAVVVTAAARLVNNPSGLQAKRVDALELTYARGGAGEWTLAERLALDRWRVRTGSV